jgi:hypothetical protein
MSIPTTAVARCQPVLSDVERMTMLGFLAADRGYARDAYALDLRQFIAWCWQHDDQLFDVHRVDIECFARELAARGRARATVARRLCTVVGFYRYAEEEGVSMSTNGTRPGNPFRKGIRLRTAGSAGPMVGGRQQSARRRSLRAGQQPAAPGCGAATARTVRSWSMPGRPTSSIDTGT